MNRFFISRTQLAALVCVVVAGAASLTGQAKSNLYKEVMDRRAKINWKTAPANAIPSDVCTILAACGAGGDKLIAMPKGADGATRVLFLSHDAKKADVVVVLRQTPAESYFFSVGPDGSLMKTAYYAPGKSWLSMGAALSKPIYEKEATAWVAQINKIAAGNSAAPAAAPAPAAEPQG
jgi:hypothetical protein